MQIFCWSMLSLMLLEVLCTGCAAQAKEKTAMQSGWPSSATRMPTSAATLNGGCRFIANDLQGGSLRSPDSASPESAVVSFEATGLETVNILLICIPPKKRYEPSSSMSSDELSIQLGARQVNGKWIPADGRVKSCDPTRFPKGERKDIDEDAACFYPDEHFKAFDFKGKNWRGIVTCPLPPCHS